MSTHYDNGNWYAVTLGRFIGLLVDAGLDPAVCFRVIEDGEKDNEGRFSRRIEMVLVPEGHVGRTIDTMGIDHIHIILAELIAKGVVT
uniref:Uncharacterized protein n=1 Tax=viral metagenome TaxID=1070528 RepID=A0A6M3IQP3_9ZZZZ